MKARKLRRRNPVALALRTPVYRQRRVQSAKVYSRKKKEALTICVCATAKRRRRQMRIDRRYRRKDPFASAKRDAARVEAEKARAQRKKKGS